MTPSIFWLLTGVALMALEAFGASGFGLFFAGLGALTAGIAVEAGLAGEGAHLAQLAWFFGATAAWALLLWKPLKRFYTGRRHAAAPFSTIVGDKALVGEGGLAPGREGVILWSGTRMKAELAPGASALGEGTHVTIVAVEGAKAIVQ